MVKVTYIEHDGTEHVVDVQTGMSLMEGAVWNYVPGILADCAGDCGCATCHVYVDEAWRSKTGETSSQERYTLRFALEVSDNSRLSCQIRITEDLEGLVVHIPERQF
jgi:2Fe-2S ferredoxin